MDTHAEVLSSVCRVGGGRFSECSHSTLYSVADHSSALQAVFDIDVSKDQKDVHPQYFCSKCERVLRRVLTGGKRSGGGCGDPVVWCAHTRLYCKICKTYEVCNTGFSARYTTVALL